MQLHYPYIENSNALTTRRFASWYDIIEPSIGTNDKGEPAFEMRHRKGSENGSDALSRRPDLHHGIAAYGDLVQEKDLEIRYQFFSGM